MRIAFLVLLPVLYACSVYGQANNNQSVRGTVLHSTTHARLQGASVVLSGGEVNEGTVTDEQGMFVIDAVPPGRYRLQVSYTGFTQYDQELAVIAGKASILSIELHETSTLLSEVTLEAPREPSNPSLHSFSIEKTLRVPANFFDPVRMATSYPTVTQTNDQANSVVIKGNSPVGVLYRLNGMDIINPNHLANAGTIYDKPVVSGGGTNILSAQMLSRTDLYTGAFPAEYGNATSGVFDMRLRDGNAERREYTAQASLVGLDLSAEGPFRNNGQSSYLINYRYSTVGLLSALGVNFGDEAIAFHDLSFNLSFPSRKGPGLKVFGFGGTSSNDFDSKALADVEEDKDYFDITYDGASLATGFSYDVPLGKQSRLFLGSTYSYSEQERNAALGAEHAALESVLEKDQFRYERNLLSSHLNYSIAPTRGVDLKVGVLLNYASDHLSNYAVAGEMVEYNLDGEVAGLISQPYVSADLSLSRVLDVQAGLRYFHHAYSGAGQLEPRVAINVLPGNTHTFNLIYRLVSQAQPSPLYLLPGNGDLGLTKAHHLEAGYRKDFETSHLKGELFYQALYDVPVKGTFSALNFTEVDNRLQSDGTGLRNAGTGTNYGVNLIFEKPMYNNYYLIIGTSYYESTYEDALGVKRDTRFNGNYSFTSTYGREWKNEERQRTIGINTRLLYSGGLRESALISPFYLDPAEPDYAVTDPYSEKLKDYFRIDLRVSFRKDKARYTRTFAIDIQNITGNENEWYHYYSQTENKIVTKYQLGIIPVLVYRIDF